MSLEWFVLGLLIVFALATNVFWAWITFNLMNRLMSRNYFDYVTSEKQKKQTPQTRQPLQDVVVDPESDRQAQELNAIFSSI